MLSVAERPRSDEGVGGGGKGSQSPIVEHLLLGTNLKLILRKKPQN